MDNSEAGTSSRKYKIVVLGDSKVGKTAIINRFMDDKYSRQYQPTVGSDLYTKTLYVHNSTEDGSSDNEQEGSTSTTTTMMRLQIWDTACGDIRFRDLVPSQLKGAAVAIIVYDISDRKTFQNCHFWIRSVREQQQPGNDDCIIYLVGNKADASNLHRRVSSQEGQETASANGIPFLEVSACAGYNTRHLFQQIGTCLYQNSNQDLDISRRSR